MQFREYFCIRRHNKVISHINYLSYILPKSLNMTNVLLVANFGLSGIKLMAKSVLTAEEIEACPTTLSGPSIAPENNKF